MYVGMYVCMYVCNTGIVGEKEGGRDRGRKGRRERRRREKRGELILVRNTHHTHPHTYLLAVSLTSSLSSPSDNERCLSW